jgi:hypothetical protein
MKIQQHTDLEVYKKAFDAAMAIFEATKKFQRRRSILSLIKSGDRHGQSVQIWRRLGESGAIRRPSFLNFPMRKAKPPKPRSGSNSRCRVDT